MNINLGTSGNRPGYKIFSFNTSVRNPKRNDDFLNAFLKFDGKVFDNKVSKAYLCELVKFGIYKFLNVSEEIKNKWENNIELTNEEIDKLIENNPQMTGLHNRVMTSYMRTLRDQGFLIYSKDKNGSRYHVISISELGKELINKERDVSIVYTRMLLGLHAKNPVRKAMFNESRPFLNSVFVIDRVNKIETSKGKKTKGVLRHEFSTFILSMKDCDYEKAADEIIKYRKKFGFKVNMEYIDKYLNSNGILPISKNSLEKDYPDDVYRKFEMTGLFVSRGKFQNVYYDLSSYNREKVDLILEMFSGYKFENFSNEEEYYDFLSSIKIPWEDNLDLRLRIAKAKAHYLGRNFNKNIPLEDEELQLDRAFYSSALSKAITKYDLKLIFNELMILSGVVKKQSKFCDISEPLRLEYLLALAIGKIYGTQGLVSNIIYNEEGEPMHWALGNKCDILLFRKEGSLILEPTMLSSREQQNRNETSVITRHASEANSRYNIKFKVIMIAPKVHLDTIDYFTYRSSKNGLEMVTLTISKIVGLLGEKISYEKLLNEISVLFNYFKNNESNLKDCVDYINGYKPSELLYKI